MVGPEIAILYLSGTAAQYCAAKTAKKTPRKQNKTNQTKNQPKKPIKPQIEPNQKQTNKQKNHKAPNTHIKPEFIFPEGHGNFPSDIKTSN